MRTVSFEVSEDILASLNQSLDDFSAEARLLLAAKLYELGRLTSGQAALLCGMGRVAFLLSLQRVGVTTSNLAVEDAADELEFARRG